MFLLSVGKYTEKKAVELFKNSWIRNQNELHILYHEIIQLYFYFIFIFSKQS